MKRPSPYHGRKVALLTQHGKERVIAPVLEPVLGCEVHHVTGFDTDQLGTFTRDIPRPGTQLNAARRKARKGMELTGLSLGLASEGSFGPDPFTGMFEWNVELLLWIDDERGIEIVGMAQGDANSGHIQTASWHDLEAFARSEGFPRHHLVMRPMGPDDHRIHKGIVDWAGLKTCFDECSAQSDSREVFVEVDLRAFANPGRMQHIAQAAGDLLHRLQSLCPACDTPGFWVTERKPGLPCAACRHPTSGYRSEVWSCLNCVHQAFRDRTDCLVADPRHCEYCNP